MEYLGDFEEMYKRKIEGERRAGSNKGKHENEVWYNREEGEYKMYVTELQTYWSSSVGLNKSVFWSLSNNFWIWMSFDVWMLIKTSTLKLTLLI